MNDRTRWRPRSLRGRRTVAVRSTNESPPKCRTGWARSKRRRAAPALTNHLNEIWPSKRARIRSFCQKWLRRVAGRAVPCARQATSPETVCPAIGAWTAIFPSPQLRIASRRAAPACVRFKRSIRQRFAECPTQGHGGERPRLPTPRPQRSPRLKLIEPDARLRSGKRFVAASDDSNFCSVRKESLSDDPSERQTNFNP